MKFLIFLIILLNTHLATSTETSKQTSTEVSKQKNKNTEFKKAVRYLHQSKGKEARDIFLKLLKSDSSFGLRYNLALSYLQNNQLALAKAYLRQLMFEDGLNTRVRKAFRQVDSYKFSEFWLWIPPDFFYALVTLLFGLWVLFFTQKKRFHKWVGFLLFLVVIGDFGYLFFRYRFSYGTLTKDTKVFSAPDLQSALVSKLLAGRLIAVRKKSKDWTQISFSHQKGWVKELELIDIR